MAVHFLHTSDWHLGQFFHHHEREYEHTEFLNWLLTQIKSKQPNALLIAGDIFDVVNPASSAQKQLYQFLTDAHALAPHMQTLMIAGNHDSGYRIEQVEPFLDRFNAKAVGVIGKTAEQKLDLDKLLVPIYDAAQNIVAWCLTLPYLRSAEITGLNEHSGDNQSAVAYLHQQLIAEAKARKQPDQALILMSHAHMQGGETSDSERPIVVGNEEALSTALFDEVIDYVALGHLHKPQQVGQPHIRYSGSPIPLSFSELNYKHQVLEVRIDPLQADAQRFQYESLLIPRTVELLRIRCELSELITELNKLPKDEIAEVCARHFLEIEYISDAPPPIDLRQQIEQALPVNRYRLLRIARRFQNNESSNVQQSKIDLEPPTPEKLFLDLWEKMGYHPDPEVSQDFLQLLAEAQQELDQNKA
ncbi:MAG: exonuclease SbcCD subunit D C-terminal domain-containing protein [Acinetobacter sp.]|uniref:exonuclease SbcCD subunit D n=1 Tax=Acinetobacter sp. TaxID=472 RepID=UPI0026DED3BD|nr:exonuclease SbcCD subunit D C-terminal domain-containing protein [Acinetobacter sp.]MDO5543016.1 exonuclease SbcCD subunit D C-terminal domain-containing protein [Acinetobacter sp.]